MNRRTTTYLRMQLWYAKYEQSKENPYGRTHHMGWIID